MGQAGAQREPSMEEILASIRRIIENNDTEALPADIADHAEADERAAPVSAGNYYSSDDDAATVEDFPAMEAAPRAEAPAPVAPPIDRGPIDRGIAEPAEPDTDRNTAPAPRIESEPAEAETAPVSLADVAARMRSEPSAPLSTVLDDAAVAELQHMFDEEAVNLQPQGQARKAEPPAEGLQVVARAMAAADAGRQEPASSEQAAAAPNQLISMDAGAKVAASFEALNAAVAAGSVRSFDEIAEDLLRPMLQSWLDDNLPTLVERLVREEIERVSRGPRR